MKAHVIREANGDLTLLTPHHASFVEHLKTVVPYNYRSYDDESKHWTIFPSYTDRALRVVHQHFDDVRVIHADGREAPQASSSPFSGRTSSSAYSTYGGWPFTEEQARRSHRQQSDQDVTDFLNDVFARGLNLEPERGGLCSSPHHHSNSQQCLDQIQKLYPSHKLLHLLPGAPLAVVDAAWRALVRTVHPDVGGSHEAMKALNAAHETLKKAGA